MNNIGNPLKLHFWDYVYVNTTTIAALRLRFSYASKQARKVYA